MKNILFKNLGLTKMMAGLIAGLSIFLFVLPSLADGREECSFVCKWIPAPSEMHRALRQAPHSQLNNPTIKVLAWNIHKGSDPQFLQDFPQLANNRDLVMLSEVTDGSEVKPAFDQSLMFGWDLGISFFMKNDIMTGLATGSIAQPMTLQVIRSPRKEPLVASYKLILVTTYHHADSGLNIMVLNIHGINFVPDSYFEEQLTAVAPLIAGHLGPVIFAGDFNLRTEDRKTMAKKILGQVGLERVIWENAPAGKQLDDAYTRGFKVERARLITEVIGRSSDHPAIDLELRPLAAPKQMVTQRR